MKAKSLYSFYRSFLLAGILITQLVINVQLVLAVAPSNDDIDNATVITTTPYSDTISDVTTSATPQIGDPANDDPVIKCTNATGLATVWYKFDAVSEGVLEVSTADSGYDTVVAVWSGSRGALNLISCNDDWMGTFQSFSKAHVLAGNTYFIEVAQIGGTSGASAQSSGSGEVGAQSVPNQLVLNIDFYEAKVGTIGTYDDTDAAWSYSGSWSTWSGTGPISNTMHYTNATGAGATFIFQSPAQFTLFFEKASNRSNILVSVDGETPVAVPAYSATALWQQSYTSAMYSDYGVHTVVVNTPGNGKYIDVDAIQIVGPPTPKGPGTYDDMDAAWAYSGSWSTWSGTGPISNTMHYSNASGASASFTFQAPAQFTLFFEKASNRSNILVSVDGGAAVLVPAYSATALWQQSYTSAMYSDSGSHTVTVSTPGDGKYIDVDAIQIVGPPTPKGPGTYDDMDAAWAYSGSWSTWSGTGPISNTMHYSNASGASASFTFQAPAKFTLFFQKASNRSNILVSVDGGTAVLVPAYSATALWQQSYTSIVYPDNGSHTVTVSTPGDGKYIDVDAITIATPLDTVAPAAITDLAAATGTNPGEVDLNWTAVGDDGNSGTASSYLVRYSTVAINDETAWTTATAVTTGVPVPQIAGQAESMTVSGLVPGVKYYFAVRAQDEEPNLGGLSNSPSALSQSPLPKGPGTYDDMDAAWSYSGSWSTWSGTGPISNTMHYSNASGASATFTFQAPAKFTLFFQKASNRSNILVSVDGGTAVLVPAYSATALWQQSYTSAMYSDSGGHTVTVSTPGDGKYIDVDAIQITAPKGPGTYDDMDVAWDYNGSWSTWSGTGPISNTMHYSNASGASATFTFQAPAKFTLFFQKASNRSNILVSVDGGTAVLVPAYSATALWQQSYTSAMYSDSGGHTVTVSTPGDGKYIDVDAIQIQSP